jgi:hypothetical protein
MSCGWCGIVPVCRVSSLLAPNPFATPDCNHCVNTASPPPPLVRCHNTHSLKELVRRVNEARALELTERLCEKVLSTSKKDMNARDVARCGTQPGIHS